MRVLDLGGGRASSSIFLRREFGVGLGDELDERLRDIQQLGMPASRKTIFHYTPDARALPFAAEFFDAIVCLDAFYYFGTDDLYLNYLAQFVKPGGPVGFAGAGFGAGDIDGPVPDHLREFGPRACGPSTRQRGCAGIGSGQASSTLLCPTP